jgi:Ca-activated chloride channel family protein
MSMSEAEGERVRFRFLAVLVAAATCAFATLDAQQPPSEPSESFPFKSGVELINVTATVTDASGRFVPGLRMEDFAVYEDGQPQTITHFSSERVPVSLGIVIDTSGSMQGEKMQAARAALDRFVYELLDKDDEIFIYRFSDRPMLLQGWTSDRQRLSRAISRLFPDGGTAMYDAVAEAIPLAESGKHRKRAIVVISDGNDTSSDTRIGELKQLIRQSEVMVYAVGIDGESETVTRRPQQVPIPRQPPPRLPIPIPFPGTRRPPGRLPMLEAPNPQIRTTRGLSDRVNVVALRDMTDDSGGRTEIVRDTRDLDPATAYIASELSQQYYLGYPATGKKDGQWHSIRVEVRKGAYRIRARRGYVAG